MPAPTGVGKPQRPGKIVVKAPPATRSAAPGNPADRPEPFGYKCCWFALPTDDAAAVAESLGLVDVNPSNWSDGLARAYKYEGVFVTPAVGAWTLAMGKLPEMTEAPFFPVLQRLSQRFGEAQYFGNYRVVDYYGWARAIDGEVIRAYLCLQGDVPIDRGERTPEEASLDRSLSAAEIEATGDSPREEDVLRVARQWSLNPDELDALESRGQALIGNAPTTWPGQ
jgi:hypothetical protein